jgi:uncharacterized protein DUF4266
MRLKTIMVLLMFLISSLVLSSCATVKPYQKMYLNQEDMELTNSKLEVFEINFQTYREGAAGAVGGKVGGGCGCN